MNPLRTQAWRRTVVVLATLLVVGFCVGLFAHVDRLPDIGLRCTLLRKVGRIFPGYLRAGEPGIEDRLTGSTIVEVGPRPIHSWPHFLRAVRELKRAADAGENPDGIERHGDETWARVVLELPDGHRETIWCAIKRTPLESTLPAMVWLLLEAGLFVIGALVYWHRRDDRAAGPFFGLTIVAVGAYLGGYHWWQIGSQPILTSLYIAATLLVPPVTLHLFQVFPRPKPWLTHHARLTLFVTYAVPVLLGLILIVVYLQLRRQLEADTAGAEILATMRGLRTAIMVSFAVSTLWFVAGIGCLIHGCLAAAEPVERSQAKWLLTGTLLSMWPAGYSLSLAIFEPEQFVGGGASWPMFFASACITGAFTIAITRYRLLRLDLMLNSGVVYFLISFLAGLVYYALVFTAMLLVGRQVIPGPSLGQAAWVGGTAMLLLALMDVVRGRFRRSLENLYRRDKHQLDRTLHQLSEAIEHLVEPTTLARHLLGMAGELFATSRGTLFRAEGNPTVFAVAGSMGVEPEVRQLSADQPLVLAMQRQNVLTVAGQRDREACAQLREMGGEVAAALEYEGRMLGFLVLGPKATGFYESEDINLLSALASIGALALQGAAGKNAIEALNKDLQDKVEKIAEQQDRINSLQRQLRRQAAPESGTPPSTEPAPSPPAEPEWVGTSLVIERLLDQVHKVAASPSAVLIRGESGTGKELLARAIHDHSPRAQKPFIKVHCAALSPALLESELFGHVKGAFTGAVADKVGRFELAHGGTLFLDEIGDISLDVQIKLLRVLQEKVIERVGSGEPVPVDVRIVTATHQNLERLIQQERFREDLFYRLNVIPIQVPPLREHREDIAELTAYFLKEFARQAGRPAPEIEDDAFDALRRYDWPGNVRELRNIIERAVVVAEGDTIRLRDLPAEIRNLRSAASEPAATTGRPARRSGKEERLRREREELVRVLAAAKGNKAEAARVLGIPRSTLTSRMEKHGLD